MITASRTNVRKAGCSFSGLGLKRDYVFCIQLARFLLLDLVQFIMYQSREVDSDRWSSGQVILKDGDIDHGAGFQALLLVGDMDKSIRLGQDTHQA